MQYVKLGISPTASRGIGAKKLLEIIARHRIRLYKEIVSALLLSDELEGQLMPIVITLERSVPSEAGSLQRLFCELP